MGSAEMPPDGRAPHLTRQAVNLAGLSGKRLPPTSTGWASWRRRPRTAGPAQGSPDGTYPKRHWLSIRKGTTRMMMQPPALTDADIAWCVPGLRQGLRPRQQPHGATDPGGITVKCGSGDPLRTKRAATHLPAACRYRVPPLPAEIAVRISTPQVKNATTLPTGQASRRLGAPAPGLRSARRPTLIIALPASGMRCVAGPD